jgi:hypothetical protein
MHATPDTNLVIERKLAGGRVIRGVRFLQIMEACMKIMNGILVLATLSIVNVGVARACTCIGPADAREGLELSEAVFSGRVIKADEFGAEVEAERVWKGNLTKTRVTVLNPAPGTSCSIALTRGARYIIFASVEKERGRFVYTPKICFPTSTLSKAEQTLKELGEGKPLKKRRRSARGW